MNYDNTRFDHKQFFTTDEIAMLDDINTSLPLEKFLQNNNFVEKFGFDLIYTSAKIEGNTYTKAEALTLLDFGKTAYAKDYTDAKMLINLKKVYNFMLDDDCHINKNKIHQIHTMLSDDLLSPDQQGKARQTSVLVKGCDYIPLDNAIMLQSEFDRLLDTSETITNPYDKAIYLHNNIAYLQYFADVNKRTARTVLNLSLMCSDKMLVIPNESLIPIYVSGILDYYNSGETLKLKEFFLQSYLWVHKQTKGKI